MKSRRVALGLAVGLMATSFGLASAQVAFGSGEPDDPDLTYEQQAATAEGPQSPEVLIQEFAEAHGSPGIWAVDGQPVLVRVPEESKDVLTEGTLSQFGVPFDIEPSDYSQTTFAALRETTDALYESNGDEESIGFTYYPETDVLAITSMASDEVLRPLLGIVPNAKRELWGVVGQSRNNDTSPFAGGAAIYSGGGLCSSAFRVSDGQGHQLMVTAAHCYAKGSTVKSTSTGATWGTITKRSTTMDSEAISGGSYRSFVYTGSSTSTTTYPVLGAANPVAGMTYLCRSARSGTNCAHTVNSGSSYQCYSGVCATLFSYVGGTLSLGGDSGGTMFTSFVSAGVLRAEIRGMHTAIATSGSTMYGVAYTDISSALTVYVWNGP